MPATAPTLLLLMSACASLPAGSGETTHDYELPPNVYFAGTFEPAGSQRFDMQRLFFEVANVWSNCRADVMAAIFAEDVDFSYPTTRRRGLEASLADLAGFCEIAQDTSVYFPADSFYIDTVHGRIAAEMQFRTTIDGKRQSVNDVWIGTVEDGKITIMKEYLDGRVKTLQAEGVLTLGESAPFLTPWPPRTDGSETP